MYNPAKLAELNFHEKFNFEFKIIKKGFLPNKQLNYNDYIGKIDIDSCRIDIDYCRIYYDKDGKVNKTARRE